MSNLGCITTVEKRCLLASFKKSIEIWFQFYTPKESCSSNVYEASLEQIQLTCVEILLHGLKLRAAEACPRITSSAANHSPVKGADLCTDVGVMKLIEDFEWVQRSARIRNSPVHPANEVSPKTNDFFHDSTSPNKAKIVKRFLQSWTLNNLKLNSLCASLQAFVTDKELLEYYYTNDAFIRSQSYATAFFICLSALELRQCSLLSQIEAALYSPLVAAIGTNCMKHKRSTSHPNFSISPPKKSLLRLNIRNDEIEKDKRKGKQTLTSKTQRVSTPPVLPAFRKTKSLPFLESLSKEVSSNSPIKIRQRSKTMSAAAATQPRNIPKPRFAQEQVYMGLNNSLTSTSTSYADEEVQPSTSANSKKSQISNVTLNSNSTTNSTSTTTSASNNCCTDGPSRIELIKCDDIKIWTDQSWELKQRSSPKQPTESCSIPQSSTDAEQVKSISPVNSFLSSLFSTPPTYTSWSWKEGKGSGSLQQTNWSEAVAASSNTQQRDISNSSSVFDAFLPSFLYGQKLRSLKSQNLFENGVSSLDYAESPTNLNDKSAEIGCGNTPKDCQSLTTFLQMAQLSRNNTDLEKENAHFRISEAIISAIEHMKWAKLEPDKRQNHDETCTATDWLENENRQSGLKTHTEACMNEHIPYAEIAASESCLDLLSAEVVGLSLISKFSEKQLPKVSELKWLISDDETPQKLLPMPDDSPTANPDENIIPSITRGTKYWAPPRQQIIFTDHPQPNRKQLIERQNNRCAGCGMRVLSQYIHSFRYCTYLGKYHCTGCHRNQMSATPAKILQLWDFKCYPVSVFAYRLLDQMYTYPLFYVPDLNPALYLRSKPLLAARNKRLLLKFVKDFIRACRFATKEQEYFGLIPEHITADPDSWSMSDFIDARNKSLQRSIDELIERCENHIFNCVLCTARGFLCEYCLKEQVIYPWEKKVYRCDRCGSCFHLNCWKSMLQICCRCERISKRQKETTIM